MFCKVISGTVLGIEGKLIEVEVDIRDGLPVFGMVGYLASEVKEAKERVITAMKNAGFQVPAKRITVNLSPADLRKEGSAFDLPIAIAVLAAAGYIPNENLDRTLVVGELGLNGAIRPVNGVLSLVHHAKKMGFSTCLVPKENAAEGAVVPNIEVIGFQELRQVVEYWGNPALYEPEYVDVTQIFSQRQKTGDMDFADVKGQETVKRAVEIAVAGMHNILLIGSPGAGKSMIAQRIPSIMPDLNYDESMELTKIYSVSGLLEQGEALVTKRPFRAPHHTISNHALIGGGRVPKPGEISLAHKGVLFLDELPEFSKNVLEVLRQPLEDRKIQISRVHASYTFPADCMLTAAMNPCPCGYYPDRSRCHCTASQIQHYLSRISHPLLDRIDISIETSPISYEEMGNDASGESSQRIKERIYHACERQKERYKDLGICFNSQMNGRQIEKYCQLSKADHKLLKAAFEQFGLSARACQRIRRVARTIADLDGCTSIKTEHLTEAIAYRNADIKYWGQSL